MFKNLCICLSLFSVVFMSGCVNRDQADTRLAKGCKAAVELYLDDGFLIKSVNKTAYSNVSNTLDGDRKVTMFVLESDGWYETEKTYSCNFVEKFGLFNSTHSAEIYQLKMNDKTYGKQNGNIVGGFQEWEKITNAVADVMN